MLTVNTSVPRLITFTELRATRERTAQTSSSLTSKKKRLLFVPYSGSLEPAGKSAKVCPLPLDRLSQDRTERHAKPAQAFVGTEKVKFEK